MDQFRILVLAAVMAFGLHSRAASISGESDGAQALREAGFDPAEFSARAVREAGLLKAYQRAWNDYDPAVTDPRKIANPMMILDHYVDGPELVYRDMCKPNGVGSKEKFREYLTLLYAIFPRQEWGAGWKNIRLYKGAAPGEWAYSYEFKMFRSMDASAEPALAGTGMERVAFDENGKLISDEVHLILRTGTATCQFD